MANRPAFSSITEIERLNSDSGYHWFKPDTLRFFGTRLDGCIYGGRYFISSEKDGPDSAGRVYNIRCAMNSGQIETLGGEFGLYKTKRAAERAIIGMLAGRIPWPEGWTQPADRHAVPDAIAAALRCADSARSRIVHATADAQNTQDAAELRRCLLNAARSLQDAVDALPGEFPVQYTAEACPGRPCGDGCDHRGV